MVVTCSCITDVNKSKRKLGITFVSM